MKSDRRTQYTKKMIKDTFLDLLIRKSLDRITVKELCEKADINRGTFYRYYIDIYDLFNQLEKEIITVERTTRDWDHFNDQESRRRQFSTLLDFINHNIKFYKVFFSTKLKSEYLETLIQNARDKLLKLLVEKKIPFDNTYFDYAFEYTRCGVIGIIRKWVDNDCQESPDVITDIIIRMLDKNPTADWQDINLK